MTNDLIIRTYQSDSLAIEVPFNGEAFFNATTAAKPFNKLPKDWLRNQDTQEYIDAVRRILLIEQDQLVMVQSGAPETGGGTWLHPKLAVMFARWLDARFAVWCDLQIENILRGDTSATEVAAIRKRLAMYEAPDAVRFPVLEIDYRDVFFHICVHRGQPLIHTPDLQEAGGVFGLENYPYQPDHTRVGFRLYDLADTYRVSGLGICHALNILIPASMRTELGMTPRQSYWTSFSGVMSLLPLRDLMPGMYQWFWETAFPAACKLESLPAHLGTWVEGPPQVRTTPLITLTRGMLS